MEPRPAVRSETTECHRRAVERVITSMGQRLFDGFSLEQMADVGVMSPFHFNRVFRQTTGIPPGMYFGILRLAAAKRLLVETDMNVTDVCFEVGYSSLGTFIRRFGELVGISPAGFRQLARDEPLEVRRVRRPVVYPRRPRDPQCGVTGTVRAPREGVGAVFVGLFPRSVPQGRPVACDVLAAPGDFHLPRVPDGRYHVFALGLDGAVDASEALLYQVSWRGRSARRVRVTGGRAGARVEVALRGPQSIDPPVVLALPALMREHL